MDRITTARKAQNADRQVDACLPIVVATASEVYVAHQNDSEANFLNTYV